MRKLGRQLIVIGAVILSGAGAGIALGDFAVQSGPSRSPGVDDGAAPAPGFDDPLNPVVASPSDPLTPAGPASYSCQGCDAGLHDDIVAEDAADAPPLPDYRPEEGVVPEPPVRQAAAPSRVPVPRILLPETPPARAAAGEQKVSPTASEGPRTELWR